MDGTPVDNNRLVLAPFLNTLTVRASPSLSASQYPKDRKSCITTKKRVGLHKNVHNTVEPLLYDHPQNHIDVVV